MIIYIIVLIILLVPLFFKQKQSAIKYNSYYWFEFFVLFLLMGLRFRVGGDSLRYELYYSYHPNLNELFAEGGWLTNEGFQPLWVLLQATCKSISDDFVIVQIINSLIVNGVIFCFVKKNVENRFTFMVLYYLLYYLYFNTEIMRESLAVVCFLMGFRFLIERKYIYYYLLSVVAFMFHASAVFLLILPFVYPLLAKLKGFKSYIILFGVALVSSFYITKILELLNNTFFAGNAFLEDKSKMVAQSTGLNIFGTIVQLLSLLPLFFIINVYKNKKESSKFILLMYLLVNIIGMIFLPLNRLSNYFSILFLCVFTNVITDKKIKFKYRSQVVGAIILLLGFKFQNYLGGMVTEKGKSKEYKIYERYMPYHSIFDKEYEVRRERAIENQM